MLYIKQSFKTGLSFGLTSGIITTLGLMMGLYSGTRSQVMVIGGILIIVVADALSDSLGIHISEESRGGYSQKEIWESTITTFFSKFFVALTFLIPILIFQLWTAVIISALWGLFLIGIFSFYIAKQQGRKPLWIILEHIVIAVLVIAATYYIGSWVNVLG